jgi:hypothetical protein
MGSWARNIMPKSQKLQLFQAIGVNCMFSPSSLISLLLDIRNCPCKDSNIPDPIAIRKILKGLQQTLQMFSNIDV